MTRRQLHLRRPKHQCLSIWVNSILGWLEFYLFLMYGGWYRLVFGIALGIFVGLEQAQHDKQEVRS